MDNYEQNFGVSDANRWWLNSVKLYIFGYTIQEKVMSWKSNVVVLQKKENKITHQKVSFSIIDLDIALKQISSNWNFIGKGESSTGLLVQLVAWASCPDLERNRMATPWRGDHIPWDRVRLEDCARTCRQPAGWSFDPTFWGQEPGRAQCRCSSRGSTSPICF